MSAFAQPSPSSAIPADKPDVTELSKITEAALIRGCASAIEEIKAGRVYIKTLEAENALQKQTLAVHAEKISLLESSLVVREKEVQALRDALSLKDNALIEYKSALELSRRELEREKKVGSRKLKIGFIGGLVTGIGLRFLF